MTNSRNQYTRQGGFHFRTSRESDNFFRFLSDEPASHKHKGVGHLWTLDKILSELQKKRAQYFHMLGFFGLSLDYRPPAKKKNVFTRGNSKTMGGTVSHGTHGSAMGLSESLGENIAHRSKGLLMKHRSVNSGNMVRCGQTLTSLLGYKAG